MVPIDFTDDDVMWVASKLPSEASMPGAEAIELINWIICFGCNPDELRFVVYNLDDWMDNSSPPWTAYRTLMDFRLVVLDKSLGVHHVVIRETLLRALTKIFMRAAGDQAKRTCGNLQQCAGLEVVIEKGK